MIDRVKEKKNQLSFYERLLMYRRPIKLLRKDKETPPLVLNLYNLSNTDNFSVTDATNPQFIALANSFAEQLLIPLFQKSPLYANLNTMPDGTPRFDTSAAEDEVAEYLGIGDRLENRVFFLLSDDSYKPPELLLIGYANGYGVRGEKVRLLFEEKFLPGATGTKEGDQLNFNITLDKIEQQIPEVIYFNGIGIEPAWQGIGLGLLLTYYFFWEAAEKGYSKVITRVVRGANNWQLFAGNENKKPLSGTTTLATYFNPRFNKETFYRAVFLSDVQEVLNNLFAILAKKISVENASLNSHVVS